MAHPSDLVLGTMYFGTRTGEAESFALLDRFVAGGGRTLDTANCYAFWASGSGAGGQSEAVIGRWLALNPGLRQELTIATKVGVEPATPGDFDGPVEGLSASVIARESARSLERLGIERIDLYWAHGEDRAVDPAETVSALGSLVQQGTVGRLGVSNHPAWRVEEAGQLARAQGLPTYEALQLTTSYVSPRPDAPVPGKDHPFGFLSSEQLDHAVARDLEIWAYSPLIQGAYDRPDRPLPEAYDHPGTARRLAALAEVARRHGVRPGQVVLAWLLAGDAQRPPIRPIVGVSSVAQLDESLAAARMTLPPADLVELSNAR